MLANRRLLLMLVPAAIAWVLFTAGCASWSKDRGLKPRTVTLAEFGSKSAAGAGLGTASNVEPASAPSAPAANAAAPGGETAVASTSSAPGSEPAPAPEPAAKPRLKRPGDQFTLNSLVGQINGRPIYADDFFALIADRILAAKRELPPAVFQRELEAAITRRLNDLVNNELIIADSYAGLSPEQKMGLFAWLSQEQEKFISEHGGGQSSLEQALAAEGLTLDDVKRMREDRALIQRLILSKVRPHVIVSWRDVEREYRRQGNKFSPPATVSIEGIRLSNDTQAALIDEVKKKLAEGAGFPAAVELVKAAGAPTAHSELKDLTSPSGRADDVDLTPEFKSHLVGLNEGDVSEPFTITTGSGKPLTCWLYVSSIVKPPTLSLYDQAVQRGLQAEIQQHREDQERDRYVAKLRERWVADDLEAMRRRLLAIAAERYLQ